MGPILCINKSHEETQKIRHDATDFHAFKPQPFIGLIVEIFVTNGMELYPNKPYETKLIYTCRQEN